METEKRLVISCHRFVVGLVGIDHVILVKCTSHCLSVVQVAQPNLEIGQSSNSILLNNLCDVVRNDGLRDAFLGHAQAAGGSAGAGPSSGETGGGRRGKRTRRHSALGGRAGDSVSGRRRADRHSVQDASGSRLGERVRGGSNLQRISWRNQEQARRRARRRPRATRSPARACVGGVLAQSSGDEGAGTRTRGGVEVVLGEQRGEERTSAIGGACTALSSEAVQENRGQERLDAYRVLPGPGHSPSRGTAGSSTAVAERGEEVRPRPKRPPRARSIEAPNTDAREAERLVHRVEQYSLHIAGLLRRGVLEPSMVCFPHDEGRTTGGTAQIQGQSSGTKSRNDE